MGPYRYLIWFELITGIRGRIRGALRRQVLRMYADLALENAAIKEVLNRTW